MGIIKQPSTVRMTDSFCLLTQDGTMAVYRHGLAAGGNDLFVVSCACDDLFEVSFELPPGSSMSRAKEKALSTWAIARHIKKHHQMS